MDATSTVAGRGLLLMVGYRIALDWRKSNNLSSPSSEMTKNYRAREKKLMIKAPWEALDSADGSARWHPCRKWGFESCHGA